MCFTIYFARTEEGTEEDLDRFDPEAHKIPGVDDSDNELNNTTRGKLDTLKK